MNDLKCNSEYHNSLSCCSKNENDNKSFIIIEFQKNCCKFCFYSICQVARRHYIQCLGKGRKKHKIHRIILHCLKRLGIVNVVIHYIYTFFYKEENFFFKDIITFYNVLIISSLLIWT